MSYELHEHGPECESECVYERIAALEQENAALLGLCRCGHSKGIYILDFPGAVMYYGVAV